MQLNHSILKAISIEVFSVDTIVLYLIANKNWKIVEFLIKLRVFHYHGYNYHIRKNSES